jgi:SAM-dependent methyltransferase
MSYEKFASVYDIMMADVPYEEWAQYIEEILALHKCQPKIFLDLGCGTGTITQLFAEKGYETIGIDLSEEMLGVARDKALASNLDILYLCQDMREFELYGTVGCVVSVCDSLNYITSENDLLKVFKLVNNYLDPEGLFIFDLNTEYKFSKIMKDNTFACTFDNSAYIWENYYYKNENINEYKLTLFIEEENGYARYEEVHYEKAYDIETITKLLQEAGLKIEGIYHDHSFSSPKKNSERIYFVAREQGKLTRR